MQDCIFCKIATKTIEAQLIYESATVVAFHDIQPAAPVHVLIVPKKHIENIHALKANDAEILYDIHKAIQEVAKKMNVQDSGYRIITNCGTGGGQTVFHLHYHLLAGKEMGALLP